MGELETKLPEPRQLHFSCLDRERLVHFVCWHWHQKASPWWEAIRWADGICSCDFFWACHLLWDKGQCFRLSLEKLPLVRAPDRSPPFSEHCSFTHCREGLCPASLQQPACLVVLSEHVLGWLTLTPQLRFSLVEFCPSDLLTTSSLSLLWAWQHTDLQTASRGSCQNSHFVSWLFQTHHQRWRGEVKLGRWYLLRPNRFFPIQSEAEITCAAKQEAKVNEMHKYSTCWGSAGWLTGKTLFKGDNSGGTMDFSPKRFLEFRFSIGCSKTNALAISENSPPLYSDLSLSTTYLLHFFHFFTVVFSFVYLILTDSLMFFYKLIFLKPLSRWNLACQIVLGKQSLLIIASSFTGAGVRQLSATACTHRGGTNKVTWWSHVYEDGTGTQKYNLVPITLHVLPKETEGKPCPNHSGTLSVYHEAWHTRGVEEMFDELTAVVLPIAWHTASTEYIFVPVEIRPKEVHWFAEWQSYSILFQHAVLWFFKNMYLCVTCRQIYFLCNPWSKRQTASCAGNMLNGTFTYTILSWNWFNKSNNNKCLNLLSIYYVLRTIILDITDKKDIVLALKKLRVKNVICGVLLAGGWSYFVKH